MSLDPAEENHAWSVEEGFNFELWTDVYKTLGLTYGALSNAQDNSMARVTMVMDDEGTLVLEYKENVNVGTHQGQVLEDCQLLFWP